MNLKIIEFKVFKHHLHAFYQLDNYPFETKVFFHSVDLEKLSVRYSKEVMNIIFSNIVFFEGSKYCMVFPETYDVTALSEGLSVNSIEAFNQWFQLAWSQHIFENDRFDYKGPKILCDTQLQKMEAPCKIEHPNEQILVANGGGRQLCYDEAS